MAYLCSKGRVKPVNIPLITGDYRYKERKYTRCIQAATNQIIEVELIYCNVEVRHQGDSIFMCEECGSLASKNHGKHCETCNKALCIEHATSKGLILKKHYCSCRIESEIDRHEDEFRVLSEKS
jgi:hypothetical protein